MTIHWCGTGLSSAPGLRRLIEAGHKVVVWNRTVEKAREAVEDFGVDAIAFGDSAGVLPIDRIRTLVPAMKSAIGDRELEFTTHCMTGLGPVQYLEAAVHGVDVIYCSIDPMANGPAPAAMQDMVRDLRYLGFEVDVDIDKLDKAGDILRAMAQGEGPQRAVLALGYAGWAPGQLESEIQRNGWLTCQADEDLLFGLDFDERYLAALRKLKIDPAMLSSDAGHA